MIKVNKKELIMINNLIQVEIANQTDKILKYVLEFNKSEKAIIVEAFQPHGKYAVFLRKELENDLKEDLLIPVEDSVDFNDVLKDIIETEEIEIGIVKNKVIIKNKKDDIELPYFEESTEEKKRKEILKGFFKTKKYGDPDNILTLYGREEPEDPEPDATCELDLKKLNIKKITKVFDKGSIELSAKDEEFILTIGGGKKKKAKNITRTIEKEDESDKFKVDGECTIMLQDTNCLAMLANYEGLTHIDMKTGFPLVLKKSFTDQNIGICYSVSLFEEE